MDLTTRISEAEAQLKNIEASLKRVLTQVEGSCIADDLKNRMEDELREMLFEVHHLVPSPSRIESA